MINSKYQFENVSVATDEGPSRKLASSESGTGLPVDLENLEKPGKWNGDLK